MFDRFSQRQASAVELVVRKIAKRMASCRPSSWSIRRGPLEDACLVLVRKVDERFDRVVARRGGCRRKLDAMPASGRTIRTAELRACTAVTSRRRQQVRTHRTPQVISGGGTSET